MTSKETPVTFPTEWTPGYRPSNGTDGDYFRGEWCDHCDRDHSMHYPNDSGPGCSIYLSAIVGEYAYPADNGPPEWERRWPEGIKGFAEHRCTAFEDCGPCGEAAEAEQEKIWPTTTGDQWKPKPATTVKGQEPML